MSIAFLEGAEYAAATSEETVMTIDYRERYHDEIVTQSDESLVFEMRDDLIAAIDELRNTITSMHDHIEDGVKVLERIVELEEVVKVQGDRIQTLLAANRELSEKVRK